MSELEAFVELERDNSSEESCFSGYVNYFTTSPDQAIGPILDSAETAKSVWDMNVCCRQGNVAAVLVALQDDLTAMLDLDAPPPAGAY